MEPEAAVVGALAAVAQAPQRVPARAARARLAAAQARAQPRAGRVRSRYLRCAPLARR